MSVTIAIEAPRQAEVLDLLDRSTSFAQALYPPESNFLLSIEELERPGVSFYVARDEAGIAVGVAGLIKLDGTQSALPIGPEAELKRMFVDEAARGRGVASLLLQRIEMDARAGGIRRLLLETGPRHEAALALYARHGYLPIPQFGQYVGEVFSVCFAKDLDTA
ncbi:GNAT family N-acetyltransferase [Luethyella okanaganae]|uniref:GNAT family N-acetyltransferase n=1 Tax=Luethyella okanaganae TaxID=69372 RepID=A0ABW1VFZ5_9MICO